MGGGCNVGLSEVVGGSGCEMDNYDGVGGGDVVRWDIFGVLRLTLVVEIVFELVEESLVLLSSTNSTCLIR